MWATFEDATATQVRNHLSRKCSEAAAATVSSMVQDMKSEDFNRDPDREELGTWFDSLHRKQAKIKNAVSLREFFEMIEDLLPGEEGPHESIEEKRHPPAASEPLEARPSATSRPKQLQAVVRGGAMT